MRGFDILDIPENIMLAHYINDTVLIRQFIMEIASVLDIVKIYMCHRMGDKHTKI